MSFLDVPLKRKMWSSATNYSLDTALVRSKFGITTGLLGKLLVCFFLHRLTLSDEQRSHTTSDFKGFEIATEMKNSIPILLFGV